MIKEKMMMHKQIHGEIYPNLIEKIRDLRSILSDNEYLNLSRCLNAGSDLSKSVNAALNSKDTSDFIYKLKEIHQEYSSLLNENLPHLCDPINKQIFLILKDIKTIIIEIDLENGK